MVGLEVHAQITATKSKLFSGAATEFGAEPNTQVSLVDAAMPGMLPVPNKECIRQAVRTGMALDAVINRSSRFDRKNYFYADLPQGYQISQLYHPLVGPGEVEILLDEKDENSVKQVGIERIHVEQDAGKLMHDQHPTMSLVDLNRCGVALMEIVSRPDMRSPAEAGAYLRKLRAILRYVGSCDGNMEEGSMRADVNVSVRKPGGELGTRTETKNVNSVRFVMAVVEHEAKRQVELIEERRRGRAGNAAVRSRQGRDAVAAVQGGCARLSLFPRPGPASARARRSVPRGMRGVAARAARRQAQALRGAGHHALQCQRPDRGGRDRALVRCFARCGRGAQAGRQLGRRRAVRGAQPPRRDDRPTAPISPEEAAELLKLVADGTISGTIAKQVFEIMLETGEAPSRIVEERGLRQTSDTGAIDAAIDKVLADNADKVEQYKAGKEALFGFFVGQTMKAMAGKANPQVVNERLRAKLS